MYDYFSFICTTMEKKINSNLTQDDSNSNKNKSLRESIIYLLYNILNKSSFSLKSLQSVFNILKYLLPGFTLLLFTFISFNSKSSLDHEDHVDLLKTEVSLKDEEIYKLRHRLINTQKSLLKLSGIAKRQNKQLKKADLPNERLPFRWLPNKNNALVYSLHISILEGFQYSKLSYTSYIPCFRISLGISLHDSFMRHSIPLYSFSDETKLSAEFNGGQLLLETLKAFNNRIRDSKLYTSDQIDIDMLNTPNCSINMLSLMVKKKYESQTYTDIGEGNTPQVPETPLVPPLNLLRTPSVVNWGIQSSKQYKITSLLTKNQNLEVSPNSLANALADMSLTTSDIHTTNGETRIYDAKKFIYIILSKSILKLSINDSFAISISI